MAGDDDAEGVQAVGVCYGSDGLRAAKDCCLLLVGYGGAVGDIPELLPDLLLEGGAKGFDGEGEGLACATEVFVELQDGLVKDGISALALSSTFSLLMLSLH